MRPHVYDQSRGHMVHIELLVQLVVICGVFGCNCVRSFDTEHVIRVRRKTRVASPKCRPKTLMRRCTSTPRTKQLVSSANMPRTCIIINICMYYVQRADSAMVVITCGTPPHRRHGTSSHRAIHQNMRTSYICVHQMCAQYFHNFLECRAARTCFMVDDLANVWKSKYNL